MAARQDLSVVAIHDGEGKLKPIEIIWPDGRRFKIDHVKEGSVKPSKWGQRYTVRIKGQLRYLKYYPSDGLWTIEKVPPALT